LFAITAGGQDRPASTDGARFDPRDFSGVWIGNQYDYNPNVPEFTGEGARRFRANIPSYGTTKGTAEAASADQHIGRRRSVPPALNNDPTGNCNPLGLTRLLLFRPSPLEIIQTSEKIVQIFEWSWDLRVIWTDGRRLPADVADLYLPEFNGYSAGRWEGDALIVETAGFDPRAWIDHFGYPMSAEARLEERWRRSGPDTLELQMTLTDPVIYTTPWDSAPVTFTRYPGEIMTYGDWVGIVPDRCVPDDEQFFYRKARDPAGGLGLPDSSSVR
jgi:hypothetical protein